jgi:hypothetical protein
MDVYDVDQTSNVQEDSVREDVKRAKGLIASIVGRIRDALSPFVKRGTSYAGSAFERSTESIGSKLPKILKPVAVVLILLFVIFLGINLFNRYLKPSGSGSNNTQQTPTVPPFKTYEPSIYVDDEEILSIENELNVLERELENTRIIESNLNIPSLDYDINFDK